MQASSKLPTTVLAPSDNGQIDCRAFHFSRVIYVILNCVSVFICKGNWSETGTQADMRVAAIAVISAYDCVFGVQHIIDPTIKLNLVCDRQ